MIEILLVACVVVFGRDLASDWRTVATAAIKEAIANPLFAGELGAQHTAAALLSVGWHESRFKLDALGGAHDCGPFQHVTHDRDMCARLRSDSSYAAHVAREDIATGIKACGVSRMLAIYACGSCECASGKSVTESRAYKAKLIESALTKGTDK